ncbi:UNVERIFIED_CONTAM: protein terminal ear1 [Sesamum calycinum]|uniref:Protein terminal ear1 n=1 Tax=Sesamum calycinum TaxID=2727403 RepID=A0AAW2R7H2_9LAMI
MALSHSSPFFTVSPPTPSITTLNPFAPEYNPIPPGITPTRTQAPQPFILPLPQQSSTVVHQLCPQPLPFFTYSSPHSAQEPFYTNYAAYYVVPELQSTATNPSPPPPPPRANVGFQYGEPGRGRTWQRRGVRGGRGRGRGRVNSWRSRENNGGGLELKFERRPNDKENVGLWSMQKEANRHKIVPLKREEEKTTVMIKNIPYDCPRQELINVLDGFCLVENEKARNESPSREGAHEEHFTSAYDFLYLPIDFRTKKSRGFAFVNFTDASTVWKFFDAFHLKNWGSVDRKKWPKKIEVVCAKIQGKEALVNHFSESTFECESDEFLPVGFNPPRDGSGQAVKLSIIGNRRAPVPSPPPHWEPCNNHKA